MYFFLTFSSIILHKVTFFCILTYYQIYNLGQRNTMQQIEKKYLLKNTVKKLVDDLELTVQDIFEFYTVVKVCKEVKFSKIDSKYIKTTKKGAIGSIDKNRVKIKKSQYIKEKKNLVGEIISKKRYLILNKGEKYAIDIYQNSLKGLYILEVEFASRKDFNKFILPEIFKTYISQDISRDKRYQKRNLALLGKPKKNLYNIYTIFKDIEHARIVDLNKIIFKEMNTSDALRIVLYKLFIELRISQDTIMRTQAEEGLKVFEKGVKKSIILLDQYNNIFDNKIVQHVISHLKVINRSFKNYNDLRFIQKEIKTISPFLDQNEIDDIHKNIEYKLSKQKHNISRFFTTREFSIIFKQYELLLKENNRSFLALEAQTPIKNSLEDKIFSNYSKTIETCDKYEGCENIETYKSVNNSLKALKTLLEEFKMIIDKESYNSMNTLAKRVSKDLKIIKNTDKKKMIIDTYLDNLETKPLNYAQLLKKINKKRKNDIDKKSEKLQKSIALFKTKKDLFK